MIYFLKTSPFCNNNCIYCEQLNKRNLKHKTLTDIEKELQKVKEKGFSLIRLSCNTDTRKDFLKILRLIKKYNFQIILETSGRMFSRPNFLKKAGEYIDRYEIYFSFFNRALFREIIGAKGNFKQSITGAKNISKFSRNRKPVIAKIVVLRNNLLSLVPIINKIKQLGFREVKFILPFQLSLDDAAPSLVEAVPNIILAKNYAEKKGVKILTDKNLEYNPYFPSDSDFFDIRKAKLEIDFKKYKEKPKFSVIIPTFNRKKTLPLVLASFLKQDYPQSKYELIVVDDGSEDNTLKAIKKMKLNCNFKYFYWPRKKIAPRNNLKRIARFYNRVGPARNIGINHAQGEIILFNDADILVTRNCLKKHEKHHDKHPNIIVRGFRMFLPEGYIPNFKKAENFISFDKISHPERSRHWKELLCRVYNLSRDPWGWSRIVTANLSVRKKYLERADGFSDDFVFWGSEDTDLGYRLSKLKMKLIWDKKIKVYHLYHLVESGDKLAIMLANRLGANILFRKYFDYQIYLTFNTQIIFCLDELSLI